MDWLGTLLKYLAVTCFLSMDPGLVTLKDAWTLFPLHPEHDAVVPPKEEIHVMAQGHLQGGTPSLWGFTFQEAACDQWVLRPRVWTACLVFQWAAGGGGCS